MQASDRIRHFENAGFDLVVIASSLGGPAALRQILSTLPVDFPAPILIVQHLSTQLPSAWREILANETPLRVEWASEGARLRARTVYLAPPDRHLSVTPELTARVFKGMRVSFARPAADLLFASAAESAGSRALALVLTGRLQDGARGAAAVRRAGGVVLAQDPQTCRAPGMPRSALQAGAVDFVLPPETIARALVSLVMVPGARALFGVERMSA